VPPQWLPSAEQAAHVHHVVRVTQADHGGPARASASRWRRGPSSTMPRPSSRPPEPATLPVSLLVPSQRLPDLSTQLRGPRVLLCTEGTYPYVGGGVSTWCDILCRQMPDVDFTLFTVTGNPDVRAEYELPVNARKMIHVPLWGCRNRRSTRSPVDVHGLPCDASGPRRTGSSHPDSSHISAFSCAQLGTKGWTSERRAKR
jgi:hypothetical protein